MDVDEKKAEPKPTFQEFMTKIVNAYKTGNNGALNNYAKLQTFAKKVGCLKLHINGDKSYNNIMWLSINNKLPNILGTCADNYTRYYIEQFLKNNKSEGKVSKWVQNNIKLDNNAAKDLFKQGISAYFKRINTCITLKPFQYIDEDINEFSKLILEIFKSISNIIKNKKYGFPTQLDFAILVKASRKDGYKKSDDSDSDSDSDTDSDDDNDNDIKLSEAFGDFKDNSVHSEHIKFSDPDYGLSRPVQETLTKPDAVVNGIRFKRFVYIIDIKTANDDDEYKNFYGFRPKKFGKIHGESPPESYSFNSKFIIKPSNSMAQIGLDDSRIFGLSFHLIRDDIIKCYQYWGQGVSRFLIDDMERLWPHMFVARNNAKQQISNEIKKRMKEYNDILTNNDIFPELIKVE